MCNETYKHFEIVEALSNANTCSLQIVAIQRLPFTNNKQQDSASWESYIVYVWGK